MLCVEMNCHHFDKIWLLAALGVVISTHYNDIIMSTMASQITSLTIVYSTIYSGTDQRKYRSSASLTSVQVNSPHKEPIAQKMFPFDDVIMNFQCRQWEKFIKWHFYISVYSCIWHLRFMICHCTIGYFCSMVKYHNDAETNWPSFCRW